MSIDAALQVTVFNALNTGDLAGMVFDDVPQANEVFPKITIGDDIVTDDGTSSDEGANVVVRVHTWSRHIGRIETKTIQSKIYDKLHRQDLSIAGWHFIGCEFIQSFSMVDEDGKTRHGVSEFRVLADR